MNDLEQLQALRGKRIEKAENSKLHDYWQRMKQTVSELETGLTALQNPPKDLRPTCERILRDYPRGAGSKQIAKLIAQLRDHAYAGLQALDEKPDTIEGLLGKITGMTAESFSSAAAHTMATIDQREAACLVGAERWIGTITPQLESLEKSLKEAVEKELAAERTGQGEPINKQSRRKVKGSESGSTFESMMD